MGVTLVESKPTPPRAGNQRRSEREKFAEIVTSSPLVGKNTKTCLHSDKLCSPPKYHASDKLLKFVTNKGACYK